MTVLPPNDKEEVDNDKVSLFHNRSFEHVSHFKLSNSTKDDRRVHHRDYLPCSEPTSPLASMELGKRKNQLLCSFPGGKTIIKMPCETRQPKEYSNSTAGRLQTSSY